MDVSIKKYLKPLDTIFNEAKQTLIDWSNINSGSYHLDGLQKMYRILHQHFSQLGGKAESLPGESYDFVTNTGTIIQQKTGNLLKISKPFSPGMKKVLLCGHMDTVFAPSDPFQTVRQIGQDQLNGPGVADMKGGLLVIYYALLALEQSPFADKIAWQILINADEEIGSLGSAKQLSMAAAQADFGLVYEPSMTPEGCFAGQRKGSGKFSIIVTGKQAHAGRAFYEGRNAICHLAAMVSDIHRLNDPTSTLTVNVGVFHGGQALNVVPDKAVAKLDVRYQTEADQVNFSNQLSELVERHQHEDYQVDVVGGFSRPTKPLTPETENLFFLLQEVGECLDQKIEWRPSGGCCDGNNLSAKGLPVIDTLGVRGGKIHSSEEFMYLDSIIERSQLSALLLMRLAQE